MQEMESYHSLLLQKKELLFKLLRLANDTALAGNDPEENAENYIGLVEVREEIINGLKKLEAELDSAKPSHMSEESALLNQEMKEMANQIIRLESDVCKKASGIMAHLRREISIINNRKKVNGGYTPGMLYERKA